MKSAGCSQHRHPRNRKSRSSTRGKGLEASSDHDDGEKCCQLSPFTASSLSGIYKIQSRFLARCYYICYNIGPSPGFPGVRRQRRRFRRTTAPPIHTNQVPTRLRPAWNLGTETKESAMGGFGDSPISGSSQLTGTIAARRTAPCSRPSPLSPRPIRWEMEGVRGRVSSMPRTAL
jgi:hypothetical protein